MNAVPLVRGSGDRQSRAIMTGSPTPFQGASEPDAVRVEFAFEITLVFGDIETLPELTRGFGRGAVYIAEGTVTGPHLSGRVIGGSGGDWAEFRPDGTVATDARYMIEADDGTRILMHNRGFLWGRTPDVHAADARVDVRRWAAGGRLGVLSARGARRSRWGPGPHDWLTRHVIVGIGTRQRLGNTIRYHAVL